jgi:hypothetical protein
VVYRLDDAHRLGTQGVSRELRGDSLVEVLAGANIYLEAALAEEADILIPPRALIRFCDGDVPRAQSRKYSRWRTLAHLNFEAVVERLAPEPVVFVDNLGAQVLPICRLRKARGGESLQRLYAGADVHLDAAFAQDAGAHAPSRSRVICACDGNVPRT